MTVPIRTRAPAGPLVALDVLKTHLRVDSDEDDALIQDYEASAVKLLDGYRGKLGRCILEQEWAVTYGQAGTFRLPMMDVVAVAAVDAGGNAIEAGLFRDETGAHVTIGAPATVVMTCALPDDSVDVARQIVRMLVGHWYANREAVITGTIATALPMAVQSLVDDLRPARL